MDLLTLVNNVLPKLGEHPVTSLDDRHPTLAVILPAVATKIRDVCQPGWWFNEYPTTLYPNLDGEILLPVGALAFVPDCGAAIQRGGKLFDPGNQTYVWGGPVAGKLTEALEFDNLPTSAQSAVWYAVLVDTYVTDIGMTNEVQFWAAQAADAEVQMQAEHLRQKKYSTTKSSRYLRYRAALRA